MAGRWETSMLNLVHTSIAVTAFPGLCNFPGFKIHTGEIFRHKDDLAVMPPVADRLFRVIRRGGLQLRFMDGDRPPPCFRDRHLVYPACWLCLVFLFFLHGIYLLLLPPKGRPCRPEESRFPVLGGVPIVRCAAMRSCHPCSQGRSPALF